MGSNLESSTSTTEKVESHQFQPEEHQAPWSQELNLQGNIGFRPFEKEPNLKQQGMLPTLELIAEPRGVPDTNGDNTSYADDPRKQRDPAQWKGDSIQYADGTPKPGDPAHWKDGDSLHYADGTAKPGDPAQWKGESTRYENGTEKPTETMKR